LQLGVAGSMVLLSLPAVLRSLHEAVGVSVWLGTFTYAYLARVAATRGPVVESLGTRPVTRVASDPVPVVSGGSR
jgi:heme A synthase